MDDLSLNKSADDWRGLALSSFAVACQHMLHIISSLSGLWLKLWMNVQRLWRIDPLIPFIEWSPGSGDKLTAAWDGDPLWLMLWT